MATITSTGIGSGLEVETIVTQLMAIEQRPLKLLQSAKSGLDTQLSAIGTLQNRMSALRDAANALTSTTLWSQSVAKSSNEAAVKVSTGTSGSAAGSYAVEVTRLAGSQTLASTSFSGPDAQLNEGTLTIELGSWTGEPTPTGFTAKSGATPVTVTLGAGETSLAAIRDKINAAGAGVSASLITDASGTRLSLRSKDTGAENAFRITASESVDDGSPASGLSALAFDATVASPMTRSQTAVNAAATINGIAISSASNTLDGVVDGLKLSLLQTTSSAVEVSVAADTDSVKKSIEGFVSAFNDVANYIREQTKYNADTKVGGTLQGDRLAVSLQSQLRAIVNEGSSASGTFERLSDIGISFTSTGTLSTDSSKLGNALGNLGELRKVLAADGADSASSGFIDRFKDFASTVLGSEGAFASRNLSLRAQISQNEKNQDSFERRLELTEQRLRRQYQSLDTAMSSLNGTSSYLTQQLALLSKQSSS